MYYAYRYHTVTEFISVQHFDNGVWREVAIHNLNEWVSKGNTAIKESGVRFILIDGSGEPYEDPEKANILAAEAVAAQAEAEAVQAQAEAKTGMSNMPGWATWTANETDDWIVSNLGDLTTAPQRTALVTAVRNMGKAITYIRDHARIVR